MAARTRRYAIPAGYSFLESFLRSFKLVSNPIEAISESMERFNGTYSVFTGFKKNTVLTQNPDFIDYILKRNHKNYHKSVIVSEKIGRFIGNGLLTSNGAYWLRQRRLIQPGFHIQKVQALYSIMQRTVDQCVDTFPTGESIDVYPLMNKLAFDIVINTLFNVELPQEARDELSRIITEIQAFVIIETRQPHKSWWFKLSGEIKKNLIKSARIRAIVQDIIRQRKASGKTYDDLLDMLLQARYEDTQQGMTEEQLIDEIIILIIAGHETTANALSWTLYLLATHPEVLNTLLRPPLESPDAIIHDEYLNAVIKESMRLYPPAWISDRVALSDDTFNGYSYPEGTIIIAYYYGLHRDPRYWDAADQFKPERFLQHDRDIQKIYFPFGAGPRLCIGNHFALAEMALFLHTFTRTFDIRSVSAPALLPLVTLRPDRVLLTIKRRT